MFYKEEYIDYRSHFVLYDRGKQKIRSSEHLNQYYNKGVYKKKTKSLSSRSRESGSKSSIVNRSL